MNLIIELLFRGLIVDFFGRRTRYIFFKITGNYKSLEYLSGKQRKQDSYAKLEQHMINVLVGLIVFIGVSFLVAYMIFGLT